VGSIPTARSRKKIVEDIRINAGRASPPFILCLLKAHIAQSVEHFLGKEEVIGPIPIVGTS
jgi:hypothetical protein